MPTRRTTITARPDQPAAAPAGSTAQGPSEGTRQDRGESDQSSVSKR